MSQSIPSEEAGRRGREDGGGGGRGRGEGGVEAGRGGFVLDMLDTQASGVKTCRKVISTSVLGLCLQIEPTSSFISTTSFCISVFDYSFQVLPYLEQVLPADLRYGHTWRGLPQTPPRPSRPN